MGLNCESCNDNEFCCDECGNQYPLSELKTAGDGNAVCKACEGRKLVERMSEDEIERFLRLERELSEYVSFGEFYCETDGEYIPYVGIWGTKVTDPRIIKLVAEAYSILNPDKSVPDYEFEE